MGSFNPITPMQSPLEEYSTRIFQLATEAGWAAHNFMKDQGEELNKTTWFAVVMEYQNLYLQLTDRMLFGRISEPQRHVVMEMLSSHAIIMAVRTICEGWPEDKLTKIQKECTDNYRKSYQDYGTCKNVFPSKNQSIAETMLWEFSKTVTELVGHGSNIVFITFFSSLVDFKRINAAEFVAVAAKGATTDRVGPN